MAFEAQDRQLLGPQGSFVGYGGLMNGITGSGAAAPALPQAQGPQPQPAGAPPTSSTNPLGIPSQGPQGLSQSLSGIQLQQVPQGSYKGFNPNWQTMDPQVLQGLMAAKQGIGLANTGAGLAGTGLNATIGGALGGGMASSIPYAQWATGALNAAQAAMDPNMNNDTKAITAALGVAPAGVTTAAALAGASAGTAGLAGAAVAPLIYGLTEYFTDPYVAQHYKYTRMREQGMLPSRYAGYQQDILSATTPEQLWAAYTAGTQGSGTEEGGFNMAGMTKEQFLDAVMNDPSKLQSLTAGTHLDTSGLDTMATAALQNQAQVIRAMQMAGGSPEALYNAGRGDLAARALAAQSARDQVTQREDAVTSQINSQYTPEQIQAAMSGQFDAAGGITPDMLAVLLGDPSGAALRQAQYQMGM